MPIAYREVLAALAEHDDIRREVIAGFRASGGSADRWQTRDRIAMVDALTACEDAEEIRTHGRWTSARAALRSIRRPVEIEATAEPARKSRAA